MEKVNAYDLVLSKMLEALEKGTVPWRQCWTSITPTNFYTKKPYHGINVVMLGLAKYECPYWIGYVQAKNLGGRIKKGEKATKIIKWNLFKGINLLDDDELDVKPVEDVKRVYPLVFNVFNLEQTENIEWDKDSIKKLKETIKIPEEIIEKYHNDNPDLKMIYGVNASYDPRNDTIIMPSKDKFDQVENYYNVYFHEMAHSTGSKNRLCREGVVREIITRDKKYSKEELIAEMTSAFLMTDCNLEIKEDISVAYIVGWSEFLKNQKRSIVSAAREAQQAVHFIKHHEKVSVDYDSFDKYDSKVA